MKWFKTKETKKYTPKRYVLFNVDSFNEWFNDKDNGATYAHPGIFLRLDKLGKSQINEYLENAHGVDLSQWDISTEVMEFEHAIRMDWRKKLSELFPQSKTTVEKTSLFEINIGDKVLYEDGRIGTLVSTKLTPNGRTNPGLVTILFVEMDGIRGKSIMSATPNRFKPVSGYEYTELYLSVHVSRLSDEIFVEETQN
jgi:hypothetical protein